MNAEHAATEPPATDGGAAGMAGIKAGLISYFAGNPVAANLLMAGVAVIGLLAGATLVVRDVPLNVPNIVEVAVESPSTSAANCCDCPASPT